MSTCATLEQIDEYARGAVDDSKTESFRAHIQKCPCCLRAYRECKANLAFVEEARSLLRGLQETKTRRID
jgi:anti-sigma factor RsiW